MTDDDARHLSRRLHWEAEADKRWQPREAAEHWEDHLPRADERTTRTEQPPAPSAAAPSFERRDLQRMDEEALDRRRQLWRDTAIVLSGVVIALLVANMAFPRISEFASASPTPIPTTVIDGPTPGVESLPAESAVPIVDPSLGIDATPTPIPIVTLPPTGTSAPALPSATLPPGATPRPTPTRPPATPRPTPRITPTPQPTPAPTPDITPPPEPTPTPIPQETPTPGP
jgi:hypothetical protein